MNIDLHEILLYFWVDGVCKNLSLHTKRFVQFCLGLLPSLRSKSLKRVICLVATWPAEGGCESAPKKTSELWELEWRNRCHHSTKPMCCRKSHEKLVFLSLMLLLSKSYSDALSPYRIPIGVFGEKMNAFGRSDQPFCVQDEFALDGIW